MGRNTEANQEKYRFGKLARKLAARANLIRLCDSIGIEFQEYTPNVHFRLFGQTVVDYWPSSQKAWLTGSMAKGKKMHPEDVVVWVKTGVAPSS